MISLPISDYPASSDPVSQIQVLSERKGEITQRLSDVQGSNLPEDKKKAETERLQNSSDDVSAQIRDQQVKKSNNEKLLKAKDEQKRVENKQLEKQDADASAPKSRLDLLA